MLSYFKLFEESLLSPEPAWLIELERRGRQWFGRSWSDKDGSPIPQMRALQARTRQVERLYPIIRRWEAMTLAGEDSPLSPWCLVYRLGGKAIRKTGFAHPSTWNQLVWLCRKMLPVPFLWQSSLRKAELRVNGMGHMRVLADGPRGALSVSSRRPEVSIARTDSDACVSALQFMEGFLTEQDHANDDGPVMTITYHPIDKPPFSLKRRFSTSSMPKDWQKFATLFEKLTALPFRPILSTGWHCYVLVRVAQWKGKEYWYRARKQTHRLGKVVFAPWGEDNNFTTGTITQIHFFQEDEVPFPLERTKFSERTPAYRDGSFLFQ
ncbi:MAG: hypothetical protein PUH55_05230 [Spirochaetales bacterium]|nr:hypothetical protein [Spirochaetales bacterium]